MTATQTALIVEIPAAEPAVHAHRAKLDRAASWGVPAHITLVYPFLPPSAINNDVLTAIAEIAGTVPRFDLTLTGTAWFGDSVLWLAPAPDQPFKALTAALTRRFPEAQPYGGAHDEIVPHLTIGHDQPRATLESAAAAVTPHLPIHAAVTAIGP